MNFEENVLKNESDLYRHLVRPGYADFETFTSSKGSSLSTSHKFGYNIDKIEDLVKISHHDYDNIMLIMNSKLLFIEDVSLIERILSNFNINSKKKKYYILYGALSTGLFTTALLFRKCLNVSSLLCLAPLCSISVYSVWQCYEYSKEINESKILTSYIHTLQKLCSDFHKLLRFLKETEILSTGQVSAYNVSAAMYVIPVNNIKDLNRFPNWKTLPHSRKFLADVLIEAMQLFSSAFEAMVRMLPSWMNIEGFKYSSKITLQSVLMSVGDMVNAEGCISIKHLQLLTDSYLLMQSEYLRCVAFCLCLVSWKNSETSNNSNKEIIFKLFEDTQSNLAGISYKIKVHFSIQDIFHNTINISQRKFNSSQFSEIHNIQVELHNIFLLMLSIVLRVRSLEDYLESNANTLKGYKPNTDNIKNSLCDHFSSLKNDLVWVQRSYDEVYFQILSKKKCDKSVQNPLNNENTNNSKQSDNKYARILGTDLSGHSVDEVFLAMSGVNNESQEPCTNEWYVDNKSYFPKTLLSELSSTLKTRKQDFKVRERLALERVGLKDIEDKCSTGSEEEAENENTSNSPKQRNIRRRPTRQKIQSNSVVRKTCSDSSLSDDECQFVQRNRLVHESEDFKISSDLLPEAQTGLMSRKPNISSELHIEACPPVLNNLSLANAVAMKSKSWGVTSEECYSDN